MFLIYRVIPLLLIRKLQEIKKIKRHLNQKILLQPPLYNMAAAYFCIEKIPTLYYVFG